jgi:hypothetical protein
MRVKSFAPFRFTAILFVEVHVELEVHVYLKFTFCPTYKVPYCPFVPFSAISEPGQSLTVTWVRLILGRTGTKNVLTVPVRITVLPFMWSVLASME